ncbi:hypothetical protein PR202_ga31502 [Eleusine coracana subsp. coracana]|uniref:Uncharacterized protein n=1 Tax=Eleusine coracana subsp. coracana TaxID=191504 RepID=A0AAV5DSM1_ELECO|nr:hypothetical protein PR202_ga31502 [Eleusine coracana subsp. coracana]
MAAIDLNSNPLDDDAELVWFDLNNVPAEANHNAGVGFDLNNIHIHVVDAEDSVPSTGDMLVLVRCLESDGTGNDNDSAQDSENGLFWHWGYEEQSQDASNGEEDHSTGETAPCTYGTGGKKRRTYPIQEKFTIYGATDSS